MAFDTWESYFYPPPDEGTLRNLFDERDPVVLTRLEYVETARRQRELLAGQVAIPKTYDADHVRAIHRHLFQDVYAWAGEFRSVNISKGAGRGFGDVKTGEVDSSSTTCASALPAPIGDGWTATRSQSEPRRCSPT